LTCADNRFVDDSTNNFAITRSGNVSVQRFNPFGFNAGTLTSYTPAVYGGSMYFDGTGDYLVMPPIVAPDTGNFTLEAWVYPTVSGTYRTVLDSRAQDVLGPTLLAINASNKLDFVYSTSSPNRLTSTADVLTNTWTHIAVVRNSGTITLYINGVQSGSVAFPGVQFGPAVWWIGAGRADASGNPGYYFTGYISNLRINYSAVYTANFTPPTTPVTAISGTSLLLNGTNAAIYDASAIANYETVGNTKISTAVSKWGDGSMAFDGTGDYLYSPVAAFNANSTFTVECWLYLTAFDAGGLPSGIFFNGTTSSNLNRVQFDVTITGRIQIYLQGPSTNQTILSATGIITTGAWYYVTAVRSSNTITVYVNGTSVATGTVTVVPALPTNLYVGLTRASSTVLSLNGYIDDFRITDGIARYTTGFTPPSAPLPLY
jgi:hypothetical protein